jgi:hypothetical protein
MDPTELGRRHEIALRTRSGNGSWSSRRIWIVVVGGAPYIRSAFGTRSAWYRRVRAGGHAYIEAGDETLRVGLEPVDDEALNGRVSAAYRAKYAPTWPGPTETLIGTEARATTMRVTT